MREALHDGPDTRRLRCHRWRMAGRRPTADKCRRPWPRIISLGPPLALAHSGVLSRHRRAAKMSEEAANWLRTGLTPSATQRHPAPPIGSISKQSIGCARAPSVGGHPPAQTHAHMRSSFAISQPPFTTTTTTKKTHPNTNSKRKNPIRNERKKGRRRRNKRGREGEKEWKEMKEKWN